MASPMPAAMNGATWTTTVMVAGASEPAVQKRILSSAAESSSWTALT